MRSAHVAAPVLALALSACIYAPHHPHDRHDASPHQRPTQGAPPPVGNPPPPTVSNPPKPGEVKPPPPTDAIPIELRLKGEDIAHYTEILVLVPAVEILIDGRPVHFELRDEVFDLAQVSHAWKLGTFWLPDGAREVEMSVRFGPTAGTKSGPTAGTIDLRAAPMRFHVQSGLLRYNKHAVVHLNVEHSLVGEGAHPLLLPNFSVHY